MLFAMVGLIAGILAGLFNPAGSGQDPTRATSQQDAEASTTTQAATLPDRFWTVVLASIPRSRDRAQAEAEARAAALREEGVSDASVLDPDRYTLSNFWAVCSGVFDAAGDGAQRAAKAHRDALHDRFPDLASAYIKLVRNQS